VIPKIALVVLCSLMLGENVWANAAGPPPNRNGVSGVYCTLCHRTYPLNSGEGSVRVIGLPQAWTPGEVYTVQVVVSDPAARRHGFQFSAVGPNGDQAGELIASTDGRTAIVSTDVDGKTVQFIRHTIIGSAIDGSNTFEFSYRAPADANFGRIRFNVAANAANASLSNVGDFIYATEIILPPVVITNERSFAAASRGGFAAATMGRSGPLAVGHGRIQNTVASSAAGLAFLSYRQSNVLVTETGFAASAPIRSGRVYAESTSLLNTGVAIANPNSQAAIVSFFFTDEAGVNFGQSSVTIGANSQIAAFVNQAPFSGANPPRPVSDARTLTFDSALPVSVGIVRIRTSQRGDLLMTSLPVADLAVSSASAISIPHIADGGGWNTDVLLVNTSDATATGTLQFLSPSGQNMNVVIDGQTNNQFAYSIPARSSRRFRTAGTAAGSSAGSVRVTPSGTTRAPSVSALLSFTAANNLVQETATAGVSSGGAFRLFVESSGNFGNREALSVRTIVGISNHGEAAANLTIEATNLDGNAVASTTLSVPAGGQVGMLANDIPGLALPAQFTGILWLSAPAGSSVSVAGFRARYNERSSPDLVLTAFPAFDESVAAAPELVFPQVVEAGGFATQFVVLGVRTGQASGNLRFSTQGGQALVLPMR
jgi:hypothetical protein